MADLPRSFAAVVMKGDDILEAIAIATRFRMPEPLAVWYQSEAAFLRELRDLRDAIAHYGHQASTVFELDWGFAVDPSESPWQRLGTWPSAQLWEGRLGSLRSVFAGFICHAIEATSRFAATLPTLFSLPLALGNDLHLYIRSPFGHQLTGLGRFRKQPWEGRDHATELDTL
jgi:hypothetical protein